MLFDEDHESVNKDSIETVWNKLTDSFEKESLEKEIYSDVESPTVFEHIPEYDVTQEDIVNAIKTSLQISPLIKPTTQLVNTVYHILKTYYIDGKKIAVLEAPTGSGKTIIGFMVYFSIHYLRCQKTGDMPPVEQLGYFLTSNKMLQKQIDNDIDRFDLGEFMKLLKGSGNYECYYNNKPEDISDVETRYYSDRPCAGLSGKQIQAKFPNCVDICPYKVARNETASKSCAVLNYAYFLNVMRLSFKPFFNVREITIADEAHLLPDIICNIFNIEITKFLINQISKLAYELEVNYGSVKAIDTLKMNTSRMDSLFRYKKNKNDFSVFEDYIKAIKVCYMCLKELKSDDKTYLTYIDRIQKNIERCAEFLSSIEIVEDLFTNRREDLFIESVEVVKNNNDGILYKHIIKDLSEANMAKEKFIKNTDKLLLMTAMPDRYVEMLGLKESQYNSLKLPSTFDFSKSPIYLTKSGYLNYKNFNSNIDNVLMDLLKICNQRHPKEKGIIHTVTYRITDMIKQKISMGLVPDPSRFLFYSNADEKEAQIEKLKTSQKPYIICGPSLYEGLDLPDDNGRFNIFMKVPYDALNDYAREKMERYPNWYKNIMLDKVIQGIGRTNRHTNDYSTCYLLDSMFDSVIYQTTDTIINRVKTLKL